MKRLTLYSALALLAASAPGCKKSDDTNACLGAPAIAPGVGVQTASGRLCLGAKSGAIHASLGPPTRTTDLAVVGVRHSHPAHSLHALYGAEGAALESITLHQGVTVTTAGGVGIGADESAVRAEFGEPVIDPFLKIWWYRSLGIAFEWQGGRVLRIQVFRPVPE